MPRFENTGECLEKINNIEILEWICPNNGSNCSKGYYPKSSYPKYYYKCKL